MNKSGTFCLKLLIIIVISFCYSCKKWYIKILNKNLMWLISLFKLENTCLENTGLCFSFIYLSKPQSDCCHGRYDYYYYANDVFGVICNRCRIVWMIVLQIKSIQYLLFLFKKKKKYSLYNNVFTVKIDCLCVNEP